MDLKKAKKDEVWAKSTVKRFKYLIKYQTKLVFQNLEQFTFGKVQLPVHKSSGFRLFFEHQTGFFQDLILMSSDG